MLGPRQYRPSGKNRVCSPVLVGSGAGGGEIRARTPGTAGALSQGALWSLSDAICLPHRDGDRHSPRSPEAPRAEQSSRTPAERRTGEQGHRRAAPAGALRGGSALGFGRRVATRLRLPPSGSAMAQHWDQESSPGSGAGAGLGLMGSLRGPRAGPGAGIPQGQGPMAELRAMG